MFRIFIITLFLIIPLSVHAQDRVIFSPGNKNLKTNPVPDSTQKVYKPLEYKDMRKGGAFRLFITTFGFGVGGFYRYQFDEEWSYQFETEISSVKADRETERFDWFGNSYTPNKINSAILIPMNNSLNMRLFKEDILDNFRPYVTASAGPLFAYEYPYDPLDNFGDFFNGSWKMGLTGYLGFGADFGSNFSALQGVNILYTFHYLPDGLRLLEEPDREKTIAINDGFTYYKPLVSRWFHGFQLSLNIGRMWAD